MDLLDDLTLFPSNFIEKEDAFLTPKLTTIAEGSGIGIAEWSDAPAHMLVNMTTIDDQFIIDSQVEVVFRCYTHGVTINGDLKVHGDVQEVDIVNSNLHFNVNEYDTHSDPKFIINNMNIMPFIAALPTLFKEFGIDDCGARYATPDANTGIDHKSLYLSNMSGDIDTMVLTSCTPIAERLKHLPTTFEQLGVDCYGNTNLPARLDWLENENSTLRCHVSTLEERLLALEERLNS